jgi:hypothetical protein
MSINDPVKPEYLTPEYAAINPRMAPYYLTAAEWQDWQATYKPIELQLMSQVSYANPNILSDAVREAQQTAEKTAGSMEGIVSRQNRSMGVAPTAQDKQTSKRLLDLNRGLMIAGAENQARANVRAQDQQILFGMGQNASTVSSLI